MEKLWSDRAWEDYLYWQQEDRKAVRKINELIKDIDRSGVEKGIGHPEPLKHRKAWSRHIDHGNRLVYVIQDGKLYVLSCRGHYED